MSIKITERKTFQSPIMKMDDVPHGDYYLYEGQIYLSSTRSFEGDVCITDPDTENNVDYDDNVTVVNIELIWTPAKC